MFVSIHIPKTAGTTLGNMFDASCGRRVMFDYDPNYQHVDRPQQEIVDGAPFINWFFQFVHGHFYYKKYAALFPDAKYISCVRHPVRRIVSQYYHVASLPSGADWRTDLIRTGKMDAVEFAKSDANITQAMHKHLEGRAIEHYDFIFLTESLQASCNLFSQKFGFTFSLPVTVNNSRDRRKTLSGADTGSVIAPTQSAEEKIYSMAKIDVQLYEKCKDVFLR